MAPNPSLRTMPIEPEFQDRAALRVMGVLVRVTPENEDFHDIWMNRFMARHDEIRPLSTDGAYYGVGFASDEQGAINYLAGMAVGEVGRVPEGLGVRDVPAARVRPYSSPGKEPSR